MLSVLPAPPRLRSAAPEERADLLAAPPALPRRGAARQNQRMLPTRPGGRPAASHPAAQQIRAFGVLAALRGLVKGRERSGR